MNNIINNITNKIKDQKVIIACSTGVDSCVLLDLCMKAIPNEQIIVAHVNHGVREESKEEESYIKSFCDSHNLILEVAHLTFTTDVNFESNARAYRYNFFTATAEKYQAQYILLAHHANDNLETMLMRLMKKLQEK
jgi:tRNA(Ile)-lysidine synthase